MTPSEQSKLDRLIDLVTRMDERWNLSLKQLTDHEARIREIEGRRYLSWRDLGVVAGGLASTAAIIGAVAHYG